MHLSLVDAQVPYSDVAMWREVAGGLNRLPTIWMRESFMVGGLRIFRSGGSALRFRTQSRARTEGVQASGTQSSWANAAGRRAAKKFPEEPLDSTRPWMNLGGTPRGAGDGHCLHTPGPRHTRAHKRPGRRVVLLITAATADRTAARVLSGNQHPCQVAPPSAMASSMGTLAPWRQLHT